MAHHGGFHYVLYLSIKMNTFSIYKTDLCKISNIMHSFIPLVRAECDDSLMFSGASSIPLCYIPSPFTLFTN